MIGTGLAYVGVAVRDVEAVAAILERDFLLTRVNCAIGSTGRQAPVFPVGQSAMALFELGDPFVGGVEKTGVHHMTVSADDPEEAVREGAQCGLLARSTEPEAGLGSARRQLLDPKVTGGVITYLSEPLVLNGANTGPVERIDHLGVASKDNSVALDAFSRRLGWPVESTQTDVEVNTRMESFTSDKYGVVYHTGQPEFVGGLRDVFITIGDCELEVLQDFDRTSIGQVAHGQSGSTRQDRGAISRYIDSRGPGLHHIGLKVQDIDGLLGTLHRAGHTMIDTVGRPGGRASKIGFIHPASLGGWLVHLVQRD